MKIQIRATADARAIQKLERDLMALGLQYTPATWFGLAFDLHLQLGHAAAVDFFAPAIGFRFRFWRGLGVELVALIPVVGNDRHDALAALRFMYRF